MCVYIFTLTVVDSGGGGGMADISITYNTHISEGRDLSSTASLEGLGAGAGTRALRKERKERMERKEGHLEE